MNELKKRAKMHKKKQRGWPALMRINKNAGNVELNNSIFNHISNVGDLSNNPISGPFGGDVSAPTAMGESLDLPSIENSDITYNIDSSLGYFDYITKEEVMQIAKNIINEATNGSFIYITDNHYDNNQLKHELFVDAEMIEDQWAVDLDDWGLL